MSENWYTFTADDNTVIHAVDWDVSHPKAVIQITHGMAEHIERYRAFAEQLQEAGYAVTGIDLRGHGRTAGSLENAGFFAPKKGYEAVIEDIRTLNNKISEKYPNTPVVLFGHSMGSLFTRDFIARYAEALFPRLAGVIISGTAFVPSLTAKMGKMVANFEKFTKGPKSSSEKLNKMNFGSFNQHFAPNRTDFDWLSRDESEVDKYDSDPMCGFSCTTTLYTDLFTVLSRIHSPNSFKSVPNNLPMFFISGSMDPVGNFGKGVQKVYELYKKYGIKNVQIQIYKDARHELLNEINKRDVIKDIINWLQQLSTQQQF